MGRVCSSKCNLISEALLDDAWDRWLSVMVGTVVWFAIVNDSIEKAM